MSGPLKRVDKLSFLGGHYNVRLNELRAGTIYCCEQISLPGQQRFAGLSPPGLAEPSTLLLGAAGSL